MTTLNTARTQDEARVAVPAGTPQYWGAVEFLTREAAYLDEGQFEEWLGMLAGDLVYRMPVRTSLRREQGPGFSASMTHFEEDRASLEMRVRRLTSGPRAWAEDPPSRTRRHIGNVRVGVGEDGSLEVRSYLLLYRSRGDAVDYELVSAERQDVLRSVGDNLLLARRSILVDQATLGLINLAIFL